jgi:hypothetical protein
MVRLSDVVLSVALAAHEPQLVISPFRPIGKGIERFSRAENLLYAGGRNGAG